MGLLVFDPRPVTMADCRHTDELSGVSEADSWSEADGQTSYRAGLVDRPGVHVRAHETCRGLFDGVVTGMMAMMQKKCWVLDTAGVTWGICCLGRAGVTVPKGL